MSKSDEILFDTQASLEKEWAKTFPNSHMVTQLNLPANQGVYTNDNS